MFAPDARGDLWTADRARRCECSVASGTMALVGIPNAADGGHVAAALAGCGPGVGSSFAGLCCCLAWANALWWPFLRPCAAGSRTRHPRRWLARSSIGALVRLARSVPPGRSPGVVPGLHVVAVMAAASALDYRRGPARQELAPVPDAGNVRIAQRARPRASRPATRRER
jgi:hypothetical protein